MRINQLKKFGIEIKKSNTILGGEKIFTYNNKQLIVYKNFGKYCIAKLKDDLMYPLFLCAYDTLNEVYYALIYLFNIDYPLEEILKHINIIRRINYPNSELPEKIILNELNVSNYEEEVILNKTSNVVREWLCLGWGMGVKSLNCKIEYVDNERFIIASDIQWY